MSRSSRRLMRSSCRCMWCNRLVSRNYARYRKIDAGEIVFFGWLCRSCWRLDLDWPMEFVRRFVYEEDFLTLAYPFAGADRQRPD